MNDLRLLQQVDPNKKVISLEFKQINTLEPMMPLLIKFENLQSLSLHGNRLKNLPVDMSGLTQLAELDLSNNLFLDMNDLAESLKTLPALTHLIMNFKSYQQENFIKNALPNLQRINKKPLNSQKTEFKFNQQRKKYSIQKLTQEDLQSIGVLYDEIREIYRNSKYFVDKELANDFDRNVENIMSELDHKLKGNQNQIEKNCNVICGKYALIDLCFVKLITYFYHFDKKIAHAFERIHDEQADMFKNITDLVFTQALRLKIEVTQVKTQKEELYKSQIKRLKTFQAQVNRQIDYLENKNKELLERLMKYGKSNAFQNAITQVFQTSTYSKSPTKLSSRLQNSRLSKESNAIVSVKAKPKTLSLHQLKEIMSEIYQSKQRHNAFCIDNHQPLQTMQTHMYTYLNQKYGLKSIAIQWAMSIVNGIKKYGLDDPEVAIFGKILRNQVEEEFLINLHRMKENFHESYRKFKKSLTQGECSEISTMESQEILLFMHLKRDQITLIVDKLKDAGMVNNLIPIDKLEKSLLDYYVKKHDEKIFQLQKQFKTVDNDEDGIINKDELERFMKVISPNVDMEKLIQLLDPSKRETFVFSYLIEKFLNHPDLREALKVPE